MRAALGALGRLYGMGATARSAAYQGGWLRQRRLPRPVVSIGNLTAGGTGKTPLVRWTLDRLIQRGLRPAILIRGYKRERGPDAIVIPPKLGRAPEPREVGDEVGWLARVFPEVPIGVSAERFRTGELIAANYEVDVFVLDDGFQHLPLRRELDVVALDATRELSDRELLPAGLQREPCAALRRAGLLVITRTELADPVPLEAQVQAINSGAPLVRARTRFDHLVAMEGATAAPDEFIGRPLHAFCGIGNPDAFFRDLRLWGFDVVRESVFPDHHVYRNLNFARGDSVAAHVTTEKDLMNLAGLDLAELGVPVLACATRLELGDAAVFDEVLFRCLGRFDRETQAPS